MASWPRRKRPRWPHKTPQGVDLTQVPDELRKWAKDDFVLGAATLINGHAAHKGDNSLVRGRPDLDTGARLDLHARLCVAAPAGTCHRGRDATSADLRAWFYRRRPRHCVASSVARCVHCRATTRQGRTRARSRQQHDNCALSLLGRERRPACRALSDVYPFSQPAAGKKGFLPSCASCAPSEATDGSVLDIFSTGNERCRRLRHGLPPHLAGAS
jgi:hypothetical protein